MSNPQDRNAFWNTGTPIPFRSTEAHTIPPFGALQVINAEANPDGGERLLVQRPVSGVNPGQLLFNGLVGTTSKGEAHAFATLYLVAVSGSVAAGDTIGPVADSYTFSTAGTGFVAMTPHQTRNGQSTVFCGKSTIEGKIRWYMGHLSANLNSTMTTVNVVIEREMGSATAINVTESVSNTWSKSGKSGEKVLVVYEPVGDIYRIVTTLGEPVEFELAALESGIQPSITSVNVTMATKLGGDVDISSLGTKSANNNMGLGADTGAVVLVAHDRVTDDRYIQQVVHTTQNNLLKALEVDDVNEQVDGLFHQSAVMTWGQVNTRVDDIGQTLDCETV